MFFTLSFSLTFRELKKRKTVAGGKKAEKKVAAPAQKAAKKVNSKGR